MRKEFKIAQKVKYDEYLKSVEESTCIKENLKCLLV